MVFELVKSAQTRWRALRGSELIAKVITGVQFKNGVEVRNPSLQNVAARSNRHTQHLTIAPIAFRVSHYSLAAPGVVNFLAVLFTPSVLPLLSSELTL
jgi:hypothetical protein